MTRSDRSDVDQDASAVNLESDSEQRPSHDAQHWSSNGESDVIASKDDNTFRQGRQVRTALENEYAELVDVSDVTQGENRDGQWVSRALAVKAVRHSTDMTAEETAATVIDGGRDYGIDAVALSPHASELWLVQAKWSDVYKGGCDTNVPNKMAPAFKLMDERACSGGSTSASRR